MTDIQAGASSTGTPIRTEFLASGARRHFMADGRVFEEDGANYRIAYQSLFPGQTYSRDVAIFGLAERQHLFEAWSYEHSALHTYAFHKVVTLESLKTGERWTGEEMRVLMGGAAIERRDG